ncbi:MAG: hypothetical protein QOF54_1861 [Solirubrobacteraceae bacterium]|nr:hypothetical protein [Solirubrobacteraceae bacterium]
MLVRRLTAALAASLALAVSAACAQAGTYHVYSCRMPDGEVAPADGWTGSIAPGGAFDDYAVNTCAEGGALVAGLGDVTVHAAEIDKATWSFAVPGAVRLAAAGLWRAGYLHGTPGENATYQFWMTGPNQSAAFDECVFTLGCSGEGDPSNPLSEKNRVTVPASSLGTPFYLNVNCGDVPGHTCQANVGDANGYAAAVYLYAADVTLEQNEGPHAGNVGGELASAPTVQGDSDVTFAAVDAGSGVYEALFSIDGQVVQRSVVDGNGGRCRDVGQTSDGTAAFLYVQPCLSSVSADVAFDTTRVSNGAHHLVVSVIDAAGNAAPVLDRTVTISNPPPPGAPNGVNASAQASMSVRWLDTRRPSLIVGYGRGLAVLGRLTGPGGAPIVGATIDVLATPAYSGARPLAMSGPRTDATGAFRLRLPVGVSSRTLRFAYRAHAGDAAPAVVRTLRLTVRASIGLSVSPHTTSVGRTIFFRGRLRAGPIPPAGKQLVLEARSPRSAWIEFEVVRSDPRGRYRASYRFKFAGPANYSFRARSEPESDYPYAAGASNVVRVHER